MYFYNFFQSISNKDLFKLICEIKMAVKFGLSTENMAVTRTKELNLYQDRKE